MLLNRKNPMDTSVHRQNVEVLLDKINGAEAILMGAAAGMSASCGFNFFYQNDALLPQELSQKGWAIQEDIAAVLRDAVTVVEKEEGKNESTAEK